MQVLLLELNEVNFDHLQFYAARGHVPHLAELMDRHGVTETTSENSYADIEPWIQWVTAHTGLPLRDHGIFRLGDIEKHDIVQVWEALEAKGLRVGAISPMNAKNRTKNAAFFVPDPWTETRLTATPLLTRMYEAIRQAVSDNAKDQISVASVGWLLLGALRYARPHNYGRYVALFRSAATRPWVKAMALDLLLADVFLGEVRRRKPHFASLFLNAAAHIQHHYLFSSIAYAGERKNPDWYVSPGQDPVADVYALYDRIVRDTRRAFPGARLMIATGLHQDPHPEVTFYWRLKDHAAFLRKIGVAFTRVAARMSRDFVVECDSEEEAETAASRLASVRHPDGTPLFEIDNRGVDLFVMLTWPKDVGAGFVYRVGDQVFERLREDVVFVAIKNGHHNGVGYYIDTGAAQGEVPRSFPLQEMPLRICNALGVSWAGSRVDT